MVKRILAGQALALTQQAKVMGWTEVGAEFCLLDEWRGTGHAIS